MVLFVGFAVQPAFASEIENLRLPTPSPAPERPSKPEPVSRPKPVDDTSYTQCIANLKALGAKFTALDPVTGNDPACGVAKPLDIDEIVPGIAITPDTQMRCATALALAKWVNQTLIPATQSLSDDGSVALSGLQHASTYVCRRRNNQPDGKLSEHAFGNAIDIRSFQFEGRTPIAIEPRERTGSIEEAFQKTARAGACLAFTTVLGPGSDGFHNDHIHLDIAERRGGYRLCQ
ncbi:MAG: extensin family protein [Pseudomonadota bacterium]